MEKAQLLRGALGLIDKTRIADLARPHLRGAGVIFCLHHVCPGGGRQKGFAPNSKLECEPEFLRGLIGLVRERGYETLSLGDAVARLKDGTVAKPFAVFTLDDGYKDNKEFAQPVFDALQCPFTVFVAPRIAEGTCELWWRLLELTVSGFERFTGFIGGEHFSIKTSSQAEKREAWKKLFPALERLPEAEQRKTIRALCAEHGIDVDAYCASVSMDWDEIRELNRDPLCTIGAHTLNHHAVGKMTAAESLFQMKQSRLELSKALGEEVKFNAYPYGDPPNATARDFLLAEEAGYVASVTTRKGPVYAGHAAHPHALPRIMISGRFQELRLVDTLISGLPTYLSNKFRLINVK